MKAELLYEFKYIFPEGDIIFIRFWKVRKNENFPEGIKYSLVYAKKKNDKYERIFGFDNEKGKSHHEHRFGEERKIQFESMEKLVKLFRLEIKKLRDELYGNKGERN